MPAYPLLDHLIRPLQERRRDRQAEGLGGLEVDRNLGPLGSGVRGRRSLARPKSSAATRAALPVYFLLSAFFSAGALDGDFAIDVVGTMMWAYGVPFHITHGPPLVQSVGYASS
jgi:hypothetical protein